MCDLHTVAVFIGFVDSTATATGWWVIKTCNRDCFGRTTDIIFCCDLLLLLLLMADICIRMWCFRRWIVHDRSTVTVWRRRRWLWYFRAEDWWHLTCELESFLHSCWGWSRWHGWADLSASRWAQNTFDFIHISCVWLFLLWLTSHWTSQRAHESANNELILTKQLTQFEFILNIFMWNWKIFSIFAHNISQIYTHSKLQSLCMRW